jgi:diguanylate cyclase (GGDEF)-like protein/PAS domain S-box-containing protein
LNDRGGQTRGWLPADTISGLGGLAAVTVGAFWWFAAGRPASTPGDLMLLIQAVAGLSAATLCWRVAGRTGGISAPRAWRLVALASALFAAADTLLFAAGSLAELAAVVRVGLLLPCAAAALALFLLPPSVGRAAERTTFVLDVAAITLAGWMLWWELALRTTLSRAIGPLPLFVPALVVADMVVLAGLASLLARWPADARRLPYGLLTSAYALLLLSDASVMGEWFAGRLHHPGRLLSAALLILAGLVEARRLSTSGRQDDVAAVRPLVVLPHVAVATAATMLIVGTVRGGPGQLGLAVSAAAFAMVLTARLWFAQREVARLRRERTVLASDVRFRSLVEQSADMIFVVDSTWMVSFASPSVPEALGYRAGQLVGASVLDLVHPEDVADAGNRLRECLADLRPMRGRWRMRRSDQTYVHTETVCVNLVNDAQIRGVVLTARDVSERSSLEAQLTHRAFHDPLTGLANRALFQDRVQHALARRRTDVGRIGVVFMDLDYFKAVNDELGHAAGDAVLRAAAQRLVTGLRAFDTAARMGGDEFAVLIDDIPRHESVMQVAERLARTFRDPFVFDGREVATSASVGVALAAPGQSAEELLRNADLAMYLAKQRGRSQAVLFEPAMHAAAITRQELQRDLRRALDRGQLSLVYHPIHALDTQAMIGAEALLRWVHPSRGPIPPSTFVPIAEDAGLMVGIGHWVLRTACKDAQAWRSRKDEPLPLRVWINLSVRQLPEDDLYDHVSQAIAESGIVPGAVVLELTERMLLQHKDRALDLMTRLKSLGIGLAIDDFGTGYSSLSHLQRLPIDILKIDRTFVHAIASDEHASTLARTVVSLGQLMSLEIVAEGIENREQAEQLRALGCNAGQGYFFGLPMSAQDLPAYAERYRSFSAI